LGEPAPPSLDFALWALEAKTSSGAVRSQVLLEDSRLAITEARAAVALGHRAFKMKIRSLDDAELALELRALVPDAVIRVDANQAFTEATVPWDVLARARVAWIEEPCPRAGAIVGAPVPIALDESVVLDANRALDDVASGRASALVLKPTLLGASETLRLASVCRVHGRSAIVSHAFESDVGRRAAEELARRIAPAEIHGLFPWRGIDAYRISAGGGSLRTLGESTRAGSALG
jgi:L-alanine-DL-glutamate epimerase-like enolase superfamily enzyme